jgi:hypothetical protein
MRLVRTSPDAIPIVAMATRVTPGIGQSTLSRACYSTPVSNLRGFLALPAAN